jgi:heterodisulfide reductase subunit A-like polyferredoxin
MARFLIIGAGISGCAAALELANNGNDVEVIEKAGKIGGKITGYSCKATDNCSRCGVCIAHIKVKESVQHENVHFTSGASVESVLEKDGKTEVAIIRANPDIDLKNCINCDLCLKACPNQCIVKYSRAGVTQYIIDYSGCLLHQGKECSICADACPAGAVYSGQKETEIKILCDGVLIASGHEPWDASKNILYGYSRLPGVITGVEAEEILSARNDFGGSEVFCGHTAFIQCVGSRNPAIGRNYCSSVCCAYALRIARVLKYRNPEAAITIYYIDIQNFDKTFTLLREELAESGIHFVRGLPFKIEQSESGRLRLLREDLGGIEQATEHDTVVLSVGLGPCDNAETLAGIFKLKTDEFGFYMPSSSSLGNIFVSGTCREPQSIFESISQARSEALEMMKTVPLLKSKLPDASPAPADEVIKIPLNGDVLVIGGGFAAVHAAYEIKSLGYKTTLLSYEDSVPDKELLNGVKLLTSSRLIDLDGHVGSFKAGIQNTDGTTLKSFGAVVLASENMSERDNPYSDSNFIIPMEEIEVTVSNLRRKKGVRSIGLVLDINIDETPAEMETALKLGLRLQKRGLYQVQLFCREAKVSVSGMEVLYNKAREAGINIIKFEDMLELTEDDTSASICCTDSVFQKKITVNCDFVGISMNGISSQSDSELVRITGVSMDASGMMQDNNIHLFSCRTNRPGIFIVGPCRGSYYPPRIIIESKAAALSVHSLLHNGVMEAELSNVVVDPDKCILCLTCIRTCPFKAMQIDKEKGAAKSIPELCQRCGLCAGECPAKAIELPLFSDQVLLDQIRGDYA